MDEKEYLGNQAIELFRQLTETFCWRERPGNKDLAMKTPPRELPKTAQH